MRRVAREVGVEAMSLYNHVQDKDDLLQGICDRVMGDFVFPEPTEDWAEMCKAGARSWRNVLQAHPDVMRLFAETHGPSPMSPGALLPTEFALRLLREGGLSDRDTVQAFHALGGYIQGFVMMEGGSIHKSEGASGVFETRPHSSIQRRSRRSARCPGTSRIAPRTSNSSSAWTCWSGASRRGSRPPDAGRRVPRGLRPGGGRQAPRARDRLARDPGLGLPGAARPHRSGAARADGARRRPARTRSASRCSDPSRAAAIRSARAPRSRRGSSPPTARAPPRSR